MAALAVRGLRRTLTGERPLATLDVAFLAPIGPGEVEITTEVLREGRYVSQASAEVRFAGILGARVHGVFAEPKESEIQVTARPPVRAKGPDEGLSLPFIPGLTPAFTQHLDYSLTEGDFPFSGSESARIGGYCRHKTAAQGVESVIALLDAWPAPVLPLGSRVFPASTVRWSLHLLGAAPPAFDGHWWFESECVSARDGYATTVGRLYAGDVLVGWTEQFLAVFDK